MQGFNGIVFKEIIYTQNRITRTCLTLQNTTNYFSCTAQYNLGGKSMYSIYLAELKAFVYEWIH